MCVRVWKYLYFLCWDQWYILSDITTYIRAMSVTFNVCAFCQHDGQTPQYVNVLRYLNAAFTALFTLESAVKMFCFGVRVRAPWRSQVVGLLWLGGGSQMQEGFGQGHHFEVFDHSWWLRLIWFTEIYFLSTVFEHFFLKKTWVKVDCVLKQFFVQFRRALIAALCYSYFVTQPYHVRPSPIFGNKVIKVKSSVTE